MRGEVGGELHGQREKKLFSCVRKQLIFSERGGTALVMVTVTETLRQGICREVEGCLRQEMMKTNKTQFLRWKLEQQVKPSIALTYLKENSNCPRYTTFDGIPLRKIGLKSLYTVMMISALCFV